MFRVVGCLVTILALAVPAPAHAGWGLKNARLVAERTWGIPPCGVPQIQIVSLTEDLLRGWDWVIPYGWTVESKCTIWLNRDYGRTLDSLTGCFVVVHEWGHLAGQGHTTDERSVMFERVFPEPEPYADPRGIGVRGGVFTPCVALKT